jgi:ribosomal protein S18 acetylase RimI-like enzyme
LAPAKPPQTAPAEAAPAPATAAPSVADDSEPAESTSDAESSDASSDADDTTEGMIRVRRIHRRDLNRVWEFLKRVFRLVNRETVEYQRPRTKTRFLEIYEEEGIEQLLFEIREGNSHSIVGYAECAYEVVGSDSWINERYFSNRDMRPLFVEEIAIHPGYQGLGIGSFVIEQLEHLARLRGCTHLVLEVAQNNNKALSFYRARSFYQLDAAIFLAKKVTSEPELLPPRPLRAPRPASAPPPGPPDSPARKPRKPKPAPKDSPARKPRPAEPAPKDSPARKPRAAEPAPKDSPAPRVRLARALAPAPPAPSDSRRRKRG